MFGNFLLADEINRAPAKVQSALLEVMQEHQVTIGGQTFQVPEPFLVLATQNPIESEGTYQLPEAQVDRFLFKLIVDYPDPGEEAAIVGRQLKPEPDLIERLPLGQLARCRELVEEVFVDREAIGYAVALADATRRPGALGPDRPRAVHRVRVEPARSDRHDPGRPARSRCCAAAATCCRTTCATWRPTSCAIAWCSRTTRSATASSRSNILESVLAAVPMPGGHAAPAPQPPEQQPPQPPPPHYRPPSAARPGERRGMTSTPGVAPPAGRQGPGPLPRQLLQALDLRLARRSASPLPGEHRAPGVGQGTELTQLRPYEVGDDVRQLDAAATARTGEPHVRLHVPERALTTWVDRRRVAVDGVRHRRPPEGRRGARASALAVAQLAVRRGGRLAMA